MREYETPGSSPRSWLDQVLAEYLRRSDAGELLDREQFINEHPELGDELRAFFATADTLEPLAPEPAAAPTIDHATDPGAVHEAATLPPSSLKGGEAPASASTPVLAASGPGVLPRTTHHAPGSKIRYFGDYELLEEIARGGMGVVYKARQVSLNRIVAVKMILAGQLASPDDVRRFRTEAEAAAQLQHPNIVAIHEVGEHDGQHYFSMDYVEGTSLAALVRENPLPAKQAATIVKTVAEAIQYAHTKGILHRDLKPSNVLLQSDSTGANRGNREAGSGPRSSDKGLEDSESPPSSLFPPVQNLVPKITDFGLAKRIEGRSELTGTGQILGTPSYMPPGAGGREARGDRSGERRVLARRDPVRTAHRPATVPGGNTAGHVVACAGRGAHSAAHAERKDTARPGHHLCEVFAEGGAQALRERLRACGGPEPVLGGRTD